MTDYRLTRRAEAELLDIFLYGIEQFGLSQAQAYADSMDLCFRLLCQNPRMGRAAVALGEGVRRHEHGSHVVLYELDQDGILVLSILHKRRIVRLDL